jgi:hypothetical protein
VAQSFIIEKKDIKLENQDIQTTIPRNTGKFLTITPFPFLQRGSAIAQTHSQASILIYSLDQIIGQR